jgi:hypothetical protein
MPARWLPSLAMLVALTFGSSLWAEDADARRFGDGLNFAGAGAALSVADFAGFDEFLLPVAAQPSYPGGTLGDLFNRGDPIGGFAAGFLGAGLIGLLFGHGVIGEVGSVASLLGLVFQLALIGMLGRLIWTWWRDGNAGPGAALSPRQLADAYGRPRHEGLPDFDKPADFDKAPSREIDLDANADDDLGHPK